MSVDYSWTPDVGPLVAIALAAAVYGARWRRVRRVHGPHEAGGWRLAFFYGGLGLVFIALVSPVDRIGEQLLAMHMLQHILLLDLAPILCTLGLTRVLLRPVTRRVHRIERAAGPLAHPAAAVLLYAGTIWLWHVPALYDAALRHPAVHALEHVSFAVAGVLFWWHLLSPIRSRLRLGGLGPLGYIAAAKLLAGAVGVGIAFAPHVLYHFYAHMPKLWGLTPHASQAVGGALMVVEQETVLGLVLITLFIRLLGEADRRDLRAERLAR